MHLILKGILLKSQKYSFSIYSNQHHCVKEVINGKEFIYDHNISRYEPTIQAFLQKRWTKKEEIPPKIYILEALQSIQSSLVQQELQPLDKLLDLSRLERMDKSDEFNTQYLISLHCEEYFKPLCDQYLSKVLINGRMPPMKEIQEYQKVRMQVMKYYHIFFSGDQLSELECEVEMKYLAIKQRKFFRYQATQKGADKCVWTYSQQRRVENIINWRARDLDMYDDFRPFYQPLRIDSKLPQFYTMLRLNEDKWLKRIYFELSEKRRFLKTRKKTEWFITYLFIRTMLYSHSIELTRSNYIVIIIHKALRIPPDFHIEHSLVNLHVWMMMDRMKKIGTAEAKFAYKILDEQFRKHTSQEIGKIHLRKKNDFIKDVDSYMKVSRNYLNHHFNVNANTIKNNYYKLDALVWSIVFFEKVPRYSEEVYLMAEYVKSNYDYIQTLPFKKFEDADIQFDVLSMSPDFKDKLLSVNPPMEEKEFLEEFYSDQKKKKYYYSNEFQMPIEVESLYEQDNSMLAKRILKFNDNLKYSYKKYQTLNTYDHFSNLEDQRKNDQQVKQKYVWFNTAENDQPIEDIKKQIRQRQR